ncbi:hypothetical protein NKH77_55920 [Streptomyces sp. M19]
MFVAAVVIGAVVCALTYAGAGDAIKGTLAGLTAAGMSIPPLHKLIGR